MEKRVYQKQIIRHCGQCHIQFSTGNRAALYCTEACRTKAATKRRDRTNSGEWLRTKIACGICGKEFFRTKATGPNKKYCSVECTTHARKRDYERFKILTPRAMKGYNQNRYQRHGRDTLITRLYKHYPDLPKICEAKDCNEARVLEAAHRPEFKRNGAWRTMDKYERHMFWMLCPTCHRVLDFGIETPVQLGLQ